MNTSVNDKDHLVNTQILKFRQNWPRLTDGQTDLYFRLLYPLDTALIPRIADRLLDSLEYPPKQADIRQVEHKITIERDTERQLVASQKNQQLPPLSENERKFTRRLAHNLGATIGQGFEHWLSVHELMIEECRSLGRNDLADGFTVAVENERQRRAQKAAAPEHDTKAQDQTLPEGYVSLIEENDRTDAPYFAPNDESVQDGDGWWETEDAPTFTLVGQDPSEAK